ncbi:hypothetical protein E2C01_052488 [Portunus trituberculatus]|uniref:Uncharacterized protein n=1 Tax=Portunus trituberculatus TaxID=210409 RepID=A0A5B7GLY0_PORTR|nr:hypothetical protein [Portunus trituberculatus]
MRELRVGESLKSTRHRYRPSSELHTVMILSPELPGVMSNLARSFSMLYEVCFYFLIVQYAYSDCFI